MTAPQAPSIVLYASPMSSAIPVVQAVAELEVPHELIQVDLAAGEQRRPEFLALNPNGRVPTLVVDGTPMFEALAIMQWLGDRFGVERGLWPAADSAERLQALSWSTWTYVTYSAAFQRLIHASSERVPAERHNRAQAEHAAAELQMLLGLLDARLGSRPYLLGEAFTLTDLIVGNGVSYGTFCGAPVDDHPHVQAWLRHLHARDSYKKSMAESAA
ncbi:MAG: glutathione S-transferase family protein [Deltaproteobacteria bacterium]|nr:glutathione S-transferase family protein [Deltaproteobacteria bacterium]